MCSIWISHLSESEFEFNFTFIYNFCFLGGYTYMYTHLFINYNNNKNYFTIILHRELMIFQHYYGFSQEVRLAENYHYFLALPQNNVIFPTINSHWNKIMTISKFARTCIKHKASSSQFAEISLLLTGILFRGRYKLRKGLINSRGVSG